MKRTVERFYVGGKEIGVVEEYKYLGIVVNEYLTNVKMVEERGRVVTGLEGVGPRWGK